ncbi:type I-E CRISPR-associated protein Cas7/Cse4/CasC [Actinoplanes lobatus]|uniref:CRISPR system Cascade subunit CasC n=1 Tax=Actinoplanes lobatus TaxID=113568 RepID=A0A7W7HL31_9ACTN|nr:type I-E CRISPR-associated protein Cas7/Cse4/CasC [Actinoplanes lobatus]MBB4752525.1 CRISPR system Cascade subunit CasC [Actinoplanes lobatus]GGN93983.1 type I-E CRISPR-associated protein Cas7/Cse4/CasC [Actinoplanes lobatus]GIE44825.1 type I-E CRISPR-associated protein Cas7/Cse4/CasC [Actinoplanes lobatus]
MNRAIIDVYALHTVPPSNLNRDDTGSPKTAVYGGVRRARVSSQAWKRAIRLAFKDLLDPTELGERTKRVGESLAVRIQALDPNLSDETAATMAAEVFVTVGLAKADKKKTEVKYVESGYLLFLSHQQLDNLAAAALDAVNTGTPLDKNRLKALANSDHSVDIAMFGRMVADMTDINVDAACQVAHAISVHAVDNEFDYFTAVDDRKHDMAETGAGMIGTIEFNSSTLYRYATVDVNALHETLGSAPAAVAAVKAFLTAFARSMPTGKQNTFAHRTLPDALVVRLRDTQPINLVGAFETPIRETHEAGRIKLAADALADHTVAVENAYGEQPVASWVTRVGDQTAALADLGKSTTLGELVNEVAEQVGLALGQPA